VSDKNKRLLDSIPPALLRLAAIAWEIAQDAAKWENKVEKGEGEK